MDETCVTTAGMPSGIPHGEWISLAPHGFSRYEIYGPGGYGINERPVRHKAKGTLLKVTLGTHGYPQVKPYNDQGKQETRTVHSLILLANMGPPPPGMETRHLDNDPLNYRWAAGSTDEEIKAAGGNLVYGSKPQNHADQVAAGTATLPAFPCVNRCGGTAPFDGARCVPCLTGAGVQAAALLAAGMPLPKVTRKLGYQATSGRRVYALARDFGGYRGTLEQARTQRQPLVRRLTRWLRRGDSK